ncbi:MAG: hypothetical protein JHC40_18070 [Burkholderiales bacterium]|jgi:hypothetical protein|nr:hypothetical protein [Burkholderiales bacterium]
MKFLAKLLFGALLGLLLAAVLVLWLAFDEAPLLLPGKQVNVADVERAMDLLELHDPRKNKDKAARQLALTQADLDALLNQASQTFGIASARLVLRNGGAALQASVRFERSPFRPWLNIDAQLRETPGLPRFASLRIGQLVVPGWLANLALKQGVARVLAGQPGRLATQVVQRVRFTPGQLQLAYQWREGTGSELRAMLVSPADAQRLRAYDERLAAEVAKTPTAQSVSLAKLLPPMFGLARERSASGDPAGENRAALVALTFYVNGLSLAALTPAAGEWPMPAPRSVTLAGRDDFPKHFLISATLAAQGGGALADAVGVFKEVDDARHGSGFSFNDIAADRAGTRFGELAVGSAARLQAAVAAGMAEPDFMPDVRDLPEFMPEADFMRRYGGIGAPAYGRMMSEIEARIAARPLYR